MTSVDNNFPLPTSVSDETEETIETPIWLEDLFKVGALASSKLKDIPENQIWHLVISVPTLEMAGTAFLYGWLAEEILNDPISLSPKRLTTNDLNPGQIVFGHRKATSPEFPLGREFSGKVLSVQRNLNPPRFSVQVNKRESKTILISSITDIFELAYEGNEENFIGSWDLMERKIEDISPWEALLGITKQQLSNFIEPKILMNIPQARYQDEKSLYYNFKFDEGEIKFPVSSLISQALPGKNHSNFIEVNAASRTANSEYSDFELHLMIGSKSALENLDHSSQKINVSLISRAENSVIAAADLLLDLRNSGLDVDLLETFKPQSSSIEFLAFGRKK